MQQKFIAEKWYKNPQKQKKISAVRESNPGFLTF